jgi:hypothetical protein
MEPFKPRLIHVAHIQVQNRGTCYLFLRQLDTYRYMWFKEETLKQEIETSIWGATAEEAFLLAHKTWKIDSFTPIHCGFRYTLPERDEHGINALFYQMAASYTSMTGVYFEAELGFNCIVQNASLEARDLHKKLQLADSL